MSYTKPGYAALRGFISPDPYANSASGLRSAFIGLAATNSFENCQNFSSSIGKLLVNWQNMWFNQCAAITGSHKRRLDGGR